MTTLIHIRFRTIRAYAIILFLCVVCASCKKYLETKPDKQLSTPNTIEDLQLLLDNYLSMNEGQYIPFSELLSDNYYLSDDSWAALPDYERNYYIWSKDATTQDYWNAAFRTIFQANVVLDELEEMKNQSNTEQYNSIKGSALFFRAYYYFGIAQIYTLPYKTGIAANTLGLPLRLNSNINEPSNRATLQETYDRIIMDLKDAANLLPNVSTIKSRPTKCAALGALAKTFLAIEQYDSAGRYADLTIKSFGGKLLDYNTDIDPALAKPMPEWINHPEVIIPIESGAAIGLLSFYAKIDTNLFRSYTNNDLRRVAYFASNSDGSYNYKGNILIDGSSLVENRSIMLPEMYLIRAECNARAGRASNAITDLNLLLSKRFKASQFQPFVVSTAKEALGLILRERRKELMFTGTRWTDIRRLKDDPDFSIVPKRILNGTTYELHPNSPGYALQFPQRVIDLSGMPQNN